MPLFDAPLKFGANCWNQYSDWPSFLEAERRAESLGFDSLWTWDHVYPIVGDHRGPMFEAYVAMSAVAQATSSATIGLMVGANTFRNPALVAKMVTTLDHVSNGRAYLGIGAAWFETEHRGFGLEYGDGPPERLRWLSEALPIMRGMLRGELPSAAGPRYSAREVINNPAPVQARLPILVGGSGPNVTLRLVAKYGDACNLGGTAESIVEKDAILVRHCEEIGRDEREIERTVGVGTPIIRNSRAEAEQFHTEMFERNGKAQSWEKQPIGTPEDVIEHIAPYLEHGYHHLIFGFPYPYDEETMTRLAKEVRPALEQQLARSTGRNTVAAGSAG
jgi:alkanesulfonate monooxygenase SsuD/methylene tetrahydromethanopterin reductase-like flavin-dependent oxidoreductase (luciferase family)